MSNNRPLRIKVLPADLTGCGLLSHLLAVRGDKARWSRNGDQLRRQ